MTFTEFLEYLGGRGLLRFAKRCLRVADLLQGVKNGAQAVHNLEIDREISNRLRLKLVKWLCLPRPSDQAEVGDRFRRFCWKHQQRGRALPDSSELTFGHVQTRKVLEGTLADHPKSGGRAPTAVLLSSLLREPLHTQKELLRKHLGVGVELSSYQMFSTYSEVDKSQPFFGVDCTREELVRRLGLHDIPDLESVLFWTHQLPPSRLAHQPTAFDGELLSGFCPGGRSVPLKGDDGLPEAVHNQITVEHLSGPVEKAG